MEVYSTYGGGHEDLAKKLGLSRSHTLAIGGSANSRIIRTTLKHSYQTSHATLYILGLTFLSRWELPVSTAMNEFEGAWINPQLQTQSNYQSHWTSKDTETFKDLNFKAATFGMTDMLEDLMIRLVCMVADLRSRGHQILIYNQIDDAIFEFLDQDRFKMLNQNLAFIQGLKWCAVHWQRDQGVPVSDAYDNPPPIKFRHLVPGHHNPLNIFLTDYIKQHNILK
jgi:hypothetical protein